MASIRGNILHSSFRMPVVQCYSKEDELVSGYRLQTYIQTDTWGMVRGTSNDFSIPRSL